MFELFGRKKQKIKKNDDKVIIATDKLSLLKIDISNEIKTLENNYESIINKLENDYLLKYNIQKNKLENISFYDFINDAYELKNKFSTEIIKTYDIYNTYLLKRSFFNEEKFSIEVSNHKNCVFYLIYENEVKKGSIYYDKIKKTLQVYDLNFNLNKFEENIILSFFKELNSINLRDELFFSKFTYSSLREKENLMNKFLDIEESLYKEFITEKNKIILEKNIEIDFINNKYKEEILELEEIINFDYLNKEEFKRIEINNKNYELHISKEDTAFQENDIILNDKFNSIYKKLNNYMQIEKTLDLESRHTIDSLLNKDLNELFTSYKSLNNVEKNKNFIRIIKILENIDNSLIKIDERIASMNNFDFEKKIQYLEKIYK